MNQPVAKVSRSSWVWLASTVSFAIMCEVLAVRGRNIGFGISGLGFVLLGVFAFLAAPPFTANVREFFRAPQHVEPRIAYVGGVSVALILIGQVLQWIG